MKKILCFIFMLCSLFIFVGCKLDNVIVEKPIEKPIENPLEKPTEEGKQTSYFLGELNLLGMASIKEFKANTQPRKVKHLTSNQGQVKELSDEEPTVIVNFTYPFDYVKIHSAIKFSISIPEDTEDEALEMIEASCGLGDLDVIIADFSTFVYDEEKEYLYLSVQDHMITIVGKKGIYTILSNSGSYQYDQDKTYFSEIYSSHKTIDPNGINKDFVPPFYGINVKYGYDGLYDVSFTKNENLATYDDFTSATKYAYDAKKVERVSRDTMYSVLDLTSYPQDWIEGVITSIELDRSCFTITTEKDSYIEVYLNKDTVLEDNLIEMDSIWELLEIDTHIAVRYDCWYDGYEPTSVYANQLMFS
ncbi:MAG: hypothetical protein K2N42_05970 [Anaeroplasmataceae bacterium]|nr:hypothetical protein [Anaeroplasmataceae bacterium]